MGIKPREAPARVGFAGVALPQAWDNSVPARQPALTQMVSAAETKKRTLKATENMDVILEDTVSEK